MACLLALQSGVALADGLVALLDTGPSLLEHLALLLLFSELGLFHTTQLGYRLPDELFDRWASLGELRLRRGGFLSDNSAMYARFVGAFLTILLLWGGLPHFLAFHCASLLLCSLHGLLRVGAFLESALE